MSLSHQLVRLDVNKQAGQWARLFRQVQAAEARLRQAEQETPSVQSSPPECAKQQPEFAKQQGASASREEATIPMAEITVADEQQAQVRAISSDLLYWKGGLKVLKQARLPKWRGSFQWQIEAKIEAVQAAYVTLRTEAPQPDG